MMKNRVLRIGNGLTGDGGDQVSVNQVYGDAHFPLSLSVENHAPCDINLPQFGGLFLRNVCNSEGMNKGVVTIANLDQLVRAVSDAEQVAMANNMPLFLTVSEHVQVEVDTDADEDDQTPDGDHVVGGNQGGGDTAGNGDSANDNDDPAVVGGQNNANMDSGGSGEQEVQPTANKARSGKSKKGS